jgi:hypothetical protein
MQVRTHITEVNVSGPNLSGTLVWTGIKYKSTDMGLISVRFLEAGLLIFMLFLLADDSLFIQFYSIMFRIQQ